MERRRPVPTCKPRIRPRHEPKFHQNERLGGQGKLVNEEVKIDDKP
jgi:hypothetical protein